MFPFGVSELLSGRTGDKRLKTENKIEFLHPSVSTRAVKEKSKSSNTLMQKSYRKRLKFKLKPLCCFAKVYFSQILLWMQ